MTIAEFAQKLFAEKSVALFCHAHPDGDTLGSACALKLALIGKGVSAEVFCTDAVPQKYLVWDEPRKVRCSCAEGFSGFSALCAVDNAEISRLGDFAEGFLAHKNTYSIDHHSSNTRYAKINYVEKRASNAEIVFALLTAVGVKITAEIANLLAIGIMTDTGGFRHKSVTASTFYDAAKLVEAGADMNFIYFHAFARQRQERAALFGRTMSKLRYFKDGKIAVASVRLKDLHETNALTEETEGFIDFVMGIDGVEVSACVLETDSSKFKISLRSKSVDVNAVAAMFGGGGHALASGCKITGSYEEVLDKLVFAIDRHIPD